MAVNNLHFQHVWLTRYIAHWDPCSSHDRQLMSFYRHHNADILRFTLRSMRYIKRPCIDERRESEVKQRFGGSDGESLRAEIEHHFGEKGATREQYPSGL